MKKREKYDVLAGILAFIVAVNILLYFYDAKEIVSSIGIENTYIVIFIMAVIGGLSALTGAALFTTITAFAAGGAEPLILALAGGAGIFISDTIFYFLALHGRRSVPDDWDKILNKIENRIEKYPKWMVLTGMYIYIGFTPLPNDVLMIVLVIAGYTYKNIMWVLLAGSFTIAMVTAYLEHIILGMI
ncbi:MAG: hypothetical protein COX06_02790 [Candidatus Zambryskibacteria bacterium CG22_combo_CG10-13_8_21_14_all_42_17]|uniref:TVP38/TMEM64 family membrane protein n=1 Tax=Candidatus Zambryskibacteria bacterium CG22_combo_CG10-13_8_21_14_all_42_17 TaxID=1975118 RepID=A0A2H0BCU6_9BACT|nr:MAG: hypothetical protein COX06_02790 [Candidatus Zambryskibacteria bacterium CG22_combo_CG10-13_8_21_14_all_42_17]